MTSQGKYLYFDIESYSADERHNMAPRDFMRLFQYAWDDGPVHLTTDYDEAMDVLNSAPYLVGHNIFSFDLPAMYGDDSLRPLELAQQRRVCDTLILATLLTPAPYSYTNRAGHTFYDAAEPERAKAYYALDNLAFQFNLPGKMGSLRELAKKYNPPKTRVADLDYGLIPVDDPNFLEYSVGDIEAVRALFKYQMWVQSREKYDSEYLWRELELAAINARMSSNGILVDRVECETIVKHHEKRRDEILGELNQDWDFPLPTEAKPQPWRSNAGKEIILKILAHYGIVFGEHPDWTPTEKGAPSFAGDTLKAITEGTDAEEIGLALAELQGQRSLAQLALDNLSVCNRMHPEFMPFQRSGRWSSKPGVSVWDNDNKRFFLADPGTVAVEFDLNNADARAVAAMSGDEDYAVRFEVNEDGEALYDGHNLNGEVLFGRDYYYSLTDERGNPVLRPLAKMGGHAQNYNIGAKKLAQNLTDLCRKLKLDRAFTQEEAKELIGKFDHTYWRVKDWKNRTVRNGEHDKYVTNEWGRRMPIDETWDPDRQQMRSRAYTQAPALLGQSTTREMMADALIRLTRLGGDWPYYLRATIHDALWLCLPSETAEEMAHTVVENMEAVFQPKGGIPIAFPVGVGRLNAGNFRDASH